MYALWWAGNVRVNTGSSVVSRVNRHADEAERLLRSEIYDLERGRMIPGSPEDLNADVRSVTGNFMGFSRALEGEPINGRSKSQI